MLYWKRKCEERDGGATRRGRARGGTEERRNRSEAEKWVLALLAEWLSGGNGAGSTVNLPESVVGSGKANLSESRPVCLSPRVPFAWTGSAQTHPYSNNGPRRRRQHATGLLVGPALHPAQGASHILSRIPPRSKYGPWVGPALHPCSRYVRHRAPHRDIELSTGPALHMEPQSFHM